MPFEPLLLLYLFVLPSSWAAESRSIDNVADLVQALKRGPTSQSATRITLAAGQYELPTSLNISFPVDIIGAGSSTNGDKDSITSVKCASEANSRAFTILTGVVGRFSLSRLHISGCGGGVVWAGNKDDRITPVTEFQTLHYTIKNAPAPTMWYQLLDIFVVNAAGTKEQERSSSLPQLSLLLLDVDFVGNAQPRAPASTVDEAQGGEGPAPETTSPVPMLAAALMVGSSVLELHVEGCTFRHNGRALLSTGATAVTLSGSIFEDNGVGAGAAAAERGGGRGGAAASAGGAVALLGGGTTIVNISRCTFNRNAEELQPGHQLVRAVGKLKCWCVMCVPYTFLLALLGTGIPCHQTTKTHHEVECEQKNDSILCMSLVA